MLIFGAQGLKVGRVEILTKKCDSSDPCVMVRNPVGLCLVQVIQDRLVNTARPILDYLFQELAISS